MRIENTNISLQGSSSTFMVKEVQEDLKVWKPQGERVMGSSLDIASFSEKAVEISTAMYSSVSQTYTAEEEVSINEEHELKIKLLESFIFALSGKKISLKAPKLKLNAEGYDSSGRGIWIDRPVLLLRDQSVDSQIGIIYNRYETQIEKSRVSFAAEGVVKTSDGREIKLNLKFNVDQELIQHSSFEFRAGAALKDPLVINFEGSLASFTDRIMSFDIDYNGTLDQIQMLSSKSGYLALDRNNNGVVDDGSELFGPKTNQGYAELAAYDEDGNGWIDEGDSIFKQLKIWYHDKEGNSHLAALTDKNVGAIYLGHVETEMNLYSQANYAGKLRQTGFVLLENGESRIMQELDLKI